MDTWKAVTIGLLLALLAIWIPMILERWKSGTAENHSKENNVDPLHVIFFLVDDLGFGDVSWNNPEVKTPVLQNLADQGVILDQFYAQPLCTPLYLAYQTITSIQRSGGRLNKKDGLTRSRVALLTGKYPYHVGSQHCVLHPFAPVCAALGQRLLPEYLKDQGFATYMAGKWHMGFCNRKCLPTSRGFDRFAGFYQGMIDHYTHRLGPGYDWQDGEELDHTGKGVYSTELITQRVVSMLQNHDQSRPSFTFVSYGATHTPLQAPQKYLDIYPNINDGNRRTLLGMVSAIDESVGTIIDALKERNMYDNSVVIFASDNGAEFVGLPIGSSNAPLRGSKGSLYEGASRVPAFVMAPRMTLKGHRQQGLFHITDWFSTILSLAGSEMPSDIDGIDQSQMLFHGGNSQREEFVYNIDTTTPVAFAGESAIRVGDYKLISGFPGFTDGWQADGTLCVASKARFLINDADKDQVKEEEKIDTKKTMMSYYNDIYNPDLVGPYANALKDNVMLFNIKDDPEERHDLALEQPEKVAELKARLDELMTSLVPAVRSPPNVKLPVHETGTWSHGWC